MLKAPLEHKPEEIIKKAAEARLKVSDISKKERKRLTALRELSMMQIDEDRVFESESEKKAKDE